MYSRSQFTEPLLSVFSPIYILMFIDLSLIIGQAFSSTVTVPRNLLKRLTLVLFYKHAPLTAAQIHEINVMRDVAFYYRMSYDSAADTYHFKAWTAPS